MRRRLRALALTAAVLAASSAVGAFSLSKGTFAAFSGGTSEDVNVTSAPDWDPPTVSASVIAKSTGGEPGYIKQGGSFQVYANVSDSGNPASGVGTVTANVSSVATGQTAVALSAGSFSLNGVTYNRRSSTVTANATLAANPYTYSALASDNASNSQSFPGFNVTVDNTVPAATDIQNTNKTGGTAGLPEIGDTTTFTFNDVVDSHSVLTGWTGSSTNVVLRVVSGNPNRMQVWNSSNTTQLPITTTAGLSLGRQGWVASGSANFGATGTPSTMVRSGNSIAITLGTQSGSAVATVNNNTTANWGPLATVTDRAGNAASTTAVNETGTADKEW